MNLKKIINRQKSRNILIFLIVFLFLFAFLSMIFFFKEKGKEGVFYLANFKSDFEIKGTQKIYEGELLKDNKFLAYGRYIKVEPGRYRATFIFDDSVKARGNYKVQIVSNKGKKIEKQKLIEKTKKDKKTSLDFIIKEKKEIEARLLYLRGNKNLSLKKVEVRKTGKIFPLSRILYLSLLFSVFVFIIIMAFISIIKSNKKWKLYLAVFLLLFCFFNIISRAWVSEDAFITLRHVENFLSGDGPVFNVGERVEGFSHVLWFYIISLFRGLGFNPKASVIIPGFLFSLLALYIILFKINFNNKKQIPFSFGLALLLGVNAFIDFGTSGLETSLFYFLIACYSVIIVKNYWITRPLLTGLIFTLLVFTRPDFIVFGLVLFIFYFYELIKKRIKFSTIFKFLVIPVIVLTGYEIFRMGYYASLLPNPFFTKSGSGSYFSQGFRYLLDFFEGSLFLLILILAIITLAVCIKKLEFKNRLIIFLTGFVHGFFVIRGGGDFMHGRFLLPALIFISISTIGVFDNFFMKTKFLRAVAVVLVLFGLFISFNIMPLQKKGTFYNRGGISDERYAYYKNKRTKIENMFKDNTILIWKTMGLNYKKLSNTTRKELKIAYKNIGFLGFYSGRKVYVIDRLGLTDPIISHIKIKERSRPGHEKYAPLPYLIYRKITFGKSPFPLWNKLADTKFGILWDISPRTIRKFSIFLPHDFKNNLDKGIEKFLLEYENKTPGFKANFMFFLKKLWYPYTGKEQKQLFERVYDESIIKNYSKSYRWLKNNKKKIKEIDDRVRGKITFDKFIENIKFAVCRSFFIKIDQ